MSHPSLLSPTTLAWDTFKRNKAALVSLYALILLIACCIFIPLIFNLSPNAQNLKLGAQPPSFGHLLGTDNLGRDLLSRIFYGGQISCTLAFFATLIAFAIGVSYGIISGYAGGAIDRAMMRIVEIIYTLPYVILVILLMVFIGRGLAPLLLGIAAVEWLTMARIIRGETISIKESQYIQAARALGQSTPQILTKHILPNLLNIAIICASLTVPSIILLESMLSFLGLGIQPPMTSWGDLIRIGVNNMEAHPHLLIFPSLVFGSTLLMLHLIAEGLKQAFDPRAN